MQSLVLSHIAGLLACSSWTHCSCWRIRCPWITHPSLKSHGAFASKLGAKLYNKAQWLFCLLHPIAPAMHF
ncbi:hypothetical protein B0O99DRAFT_605157 [Bisporella sp. PMI_857]|nr:hypothetical protein B0O99DRAFT_605157 [Bisporella sp. PMI_857]